MNILLLSSVVIIYLFIMGFLAYYGYKGTRDIADYMLAGREIHPAVMALSYGAAFISTAAIVGFGGAAAVFGMGLLWLTFLNIFLGIFIAFVVFGKRTRRMGLNLNVHTFPEFLGRRFDSKFIQVAAGFVIFIFMPLYAAVVLMGGTSFISGVLNIDYNAALFFFTTIIALYVIMGGLKGVMYSDAFQGSVMFIGMIILLIMTYYNLGGLRSAHTALTGFSERAVALFGAGGHRGWTAFPEAGSRLWMELVTTIILGVGIGVLAQPQLAVRFMTVKSSRELNRAVLVGGVFILVMTGGAFVVGSLSNAFFLTHPDYLLPSIQAAGGSVENIIPLYIREAMPEWFTVLFMVALLSAAMSTLSSQYHAMGTAIGRDIYQKGFGGKGSPIMIMRAGVLLTILISLFIAWGLPLFFEGGTAIIARGTAIFFGICAASFLPMYIGALYFRKLSRRGAIAGFITGFLLSLFWIFFISIKESRPLMLCQLIFGVDSLAQGTRWELLDPIVVAFPVSFLVTVIAGKFGPRPPQEVIDKSYAGIV